MIRQDPVTADGIAVGIDPEQIGGYVGLGPVDEYGGDPPLPVQFGEGVQAVLVDPALLEDAVARLADAPVAPVDPVVDAGAVGQEDLSQIAQEVVGVAGGAVGTGAAAQFTVGPIGVGLALPGEQAVLVVGLGDGDPVDGDAVAVGVVPIGGGPAVAGHSGEPAGRVVGVALLVGLAFEGLGLGEDPPQGVAPVVGLVAQAVGVPGLGVAQGAEGVVGGFAVQVADPHAAEPAAGRVVPEFEVAGPGELAVFGIVEVDAVGAGAAAAGFEVGVPGLGDFGLDGALPLDAGDQGAVVGVGQALAVVSVDALQAAGGVVAVFDGPFRGVEGAETAGGVVVESETLAVGPVDAQEEAVKVVGVEGLGEGDVAQGRGLVAGLEMGVGVLEAVPGTAGGLDLEESAFEVVAVFDAVSVGQGLGEEAAGGVPVESAFGPEGVLEAGEAAVLGAAVVPGEAVGALFGGFAPDLQGPAGGVVGDPDRGLAGGADLEGPVAVVETGGGSAAEGVGV